MKQGVAGARKIQAIIATKLTHVLHYWLRQMAGEESKPGRRANSLYAVIFHYFYFLFDHILLLLVPVSYWTSKMFSYSL